MQDGAVGPVAADVVEERTVALVEQLDGAARGLDQRLPDSARDHAAAEGDGPGGGEQDSHTLPEALARSACPGDDLVIQTHAVDFAARDDDLAEDQRVESHTDHPTRGADAFAPNQVDGSQ